MFKYNLLLSVAQLKQNSSLAAGRVGHHSNTTCTHVSQSTHHLCPRYYKVHHRPSTLSLRISTSCAMWASCSHVTCLTTVPTFTLNCSYFRLWLLTCSPYRTTSSKFLSSFWPPLPWLLPLCSKLRDEPEATSCNFLLTSSVNKLWPRNTSWSTIVLIRWNVS